MPATMKHILMYAEALVVHGGLTLGQLSLSYCVQRTSTFFGKGVISRKARLCPVLLVICLTGQDNMLQIGFFHYYIFQL